MHFAICVWGIVRSLRFTLGSFQQYCLDPITNAGHTYEIFLHTYKFNGFYNNARSGEINLRLNFDDWKLLNPQHVYVEDQDAFDSRTNYTSFQTLGDPWKNGFSSFKNHIRALNSLHYLATVVERESRKTHFDGVIFLRPDVTYINELPFYLLEHFPDALFVPDFHRSCEGNEYNDRMAMGNLTTAMAFGKKFEYALEYSQRKMLNSEKFTYDHLRAQNVRVKEIPFRFKRTRATGKYHHRDVTGVIVPVDPKPVSPFDIFLQAFAEAIGISSIDMHNVINNKNDKAREDLFCKPHPYLSVSECRKYKELSASKRGPPSVWGNTKP